MIAAGVVVFASLFVLATRQLRLAALGLIAVFVASNALVLGETPRAEITLSGAAALAAAVTLFLAAGDASFGEEPGWRVWPAIAISAVATTLAYRVYLSPDVDPYLQLSAFWLLAIGLGILIAARGPVRTAIGSLLMLTGTLDVVRFESGPHLATSIAFAWLEVVLTLVGAFLITQQRAFEERQ
ncbi:MAG: hypothetical protein AUH85_15325 [Chloroflexi bacterium 13_1_40CM_4_68_4]|nr:MAG: hypothetical protein AUH85_15325 [Chloroflexi bacterium 13_1_40CM_4_68_4]